MIRFSSTFYKSLYKDIEHMTGKESLEHFIQFGCAENRIGFHSDESKFDHKYYIKENPDVRDHCSTKIDVLHHWYNHGKKEMRLCYSTQGFLTQTVVIITRTSNRPNYFARCRQSVLDQTYPYVQHFITYDNESDKTYVNHLPNTMYIPKEKRVV